MALGIGLVSGAAAFWDGIELFDGELDRESGAVAASVTGLMGGELGTFELALGFATSSSTTPKRPTNSRIFAHNSDPMTFVACKCAHRRNARGTLICHTEGVLELFTSIPKTRRIVLIFLIRLPPS